MERAIFEATARIADKAEMAGFLGAIPNSGGLETLLKAGKAVSTRAYDDADSLARFVVSDGCVASCFTVTHVTIDEAEMIAAAFELLDEGQPAAFRTAVEQALGTDFENPV